MYSHIQYTVYIYIYYKHIIHIFICAILFHIICMYVYIYIYVYVYAYTYIDIVSKYRIHICFFFDHISVCTNRNMNTHASHMSGE